MKQKTIWLVIEQGAGIIHKAFNYYEEANLFVQSLKNETGFDCYEIQELDIC